MSDHDWQDYSSWDMGLNLPPPPLLLSSLRSRSPPTFDTPLCCLDLTLLSFTVIVLAEPTTPPKGREKDPQFRDILGVRILGKVACLCLLAQAGLGELAEGKGAD